MDAVNAISDPNTILIIINSTGFVALSIFGLRLSFQLGRFAQAQVEQKEREVKLDLRLDKLESRTTEILIAKLDSKVDAAVARIDALHDGVHDLRNMLMRTLGAGLAGKG